MPSSEECIEARNQVKEWAVQQLVNEGHLLYSAQEIVKYMNYESQIEKAEELRGPIPIEDHIHHIKGVNYAEDSSYDY
jgi:hypothetical protein